MTHTKTCCCSIFESRGSDLHSPETTYISIVTIVMLLLVAAFVTLASLERINDMKPKEELQEIINQIVSEDSPVGMDAVYVHALILDKLTSLETRIAKLEEINTTEGE